MLERTHVRLQLHIKHKALKQMESSGRLCVGHHVTSVPNGGKRQTVVYLDIARNLLTNKPWSPCLLHVHLQLGNPAARADDRDDCIYVTCT